MSKNDVTVSERGPDEPQSDSVFDFLYCDTRRIASFLAQFDDAGHLERIIQRESYSKGSKPGYSVNVGGGATVAGTGGTGSLGFSRTPETGGSESSERVYDPLWANARAFLDYIEERKLLVRNIHDARMGQFVLAKGILTFLDLDVMKSLYTEKVFSNTIKSGALQAAEKEAASQLSRQMRRRQSQKGQQDQATDVVDLLITVLSVLPHSTQARMHAEDYSVWSTISSDSMVTKTSDLLLKHGSIVQGDWRMVGVLDAMPDGGAPMEGYDQEFAQILGGSIVGTAAAHLGPIARNMLGRPPGAYGMTPLLIFRELQA